MSIANMMQAGMEYFLTYTHICLTCLFDIYYLPIQGQRPQKDAFEERLHHSIVTRLS